MTIDGQCCNAKNNYSRIPKVFNYSIYKLRNITSYISGAAMLRPNEQSEWLDAIVM